VKSICGEWPRCFKVDGELGYLSKQTTEILRKIGCVRQVRAAGVENSNPLAEGYMRITDEACTAALTHSHSPSNLWAEATAWFCYTYNNAFLVSEEINEKETGKLEKRPTSRMNLLRGRHVKADHDKFHGFGVLMYAYLPKSRRKGYGAQKRKCRVGVFVGYSWTVEMYRMLEMQTRRVIECPVQYAVLHEGKFPFKTCPWTTLEQNLPPLHYDPDDTDLDDEVVALMDPEVDEQYGYYQDLDVLDDDGEPVRRTTPVRLEVVEEDAPASLPPRSRAMSEAALRRMATVPEGATLYADATLPSNRFGSQEGASAYASKAGRSQQHFGKGR
jgi:hypothetical protein